MKVKKLIVFLIAAMVFFPVSVLAAVKDCSSYSVDSCPASNCIVENGACVKGHVGQSFCTQKEVMNALRVTGYFLLVARICIPLIVIVFGTFDMFKAVTGGDSKSLSASAKKLGIRILIGMSIFLVPSIIHIILSALNSYNAITDDANVCQTCLLKPSSCENGVPNDSNPFDEDIFDQTPPPKEESESQDEEIVVE